MALYQDPRPPPSKYPLCGGRARGRQEEGRQRATETQTGVGLTEGSCVLSPAACAKEEEEEEEEEEGAPAPRSGLGGEEGRASNCTATQGKA
jgi:hypothetical protein